MKVLHVIHRFVDTDPRGSELYTYYLCRALAKKHEVAVLYGSPTIPPNRVDCGRFDGLKTFVIGSSHSWPEAMLRARSRKAEIAFTEVLAEWKPEIVHFQHLLFHSLRLPTIAKRAGVRSLFTLHDFWLLCPQIQLLDHQQHISWPIDRRNCYDCCLTKMKRAHSWRRLWGWDPLLLLRRAIREYYLRWGRPRSVARLTRAVDLFVAPSRQLRERFIHEGLLPSKVVYCRNGIDHDLRPAHFIPKRYAGGRVECGFVGSLAMHKGIEVLLEAFRSVQGANLRVYGKTTPQYLNRIRNGTVRFMGEITDSEKAAAFSQMDVLIVPSIWLENSPLTIQEAFLFGVPVITSNIGGMAELVEDGKNGLLFKVGDPEDLRRKITYLATHPEELQRLAANIPPVKRIEDHAQEIEGYYHKVLSSHSRI